MLTTFKLLSAMWKLYLRFFFSKLHGSEKKLFFTNNIKMHVRYAFECITENKK